MNKEKETITIPKKEYEELIKSDNQLKKVNKNIENVLEEMERIGFNKKDKPNINKYVKVTKPTSLGKLDPDIVNKVNLYCSLTGMKRTEFITNLIKKELNEKVLSNDSFIFHKEPFYFNLNQLLEDKEVEATKQKPISDFKNQMVIFRTPNNLDKWDSSKKTFSSGNDKHEGIIPFILPYEMRDDKQDINLYFLVFRFEAHNDKLKIALLDFEDLKFILNPLLHERKDESLISIFNILNGVIDRHNKNKEVEDEETIKSIILKYNCILSFEQLKEECFSAPERILFKIFVIGGFNTFFKKESSDISDDIPADVFKKIYY